MRNISQWAVGLFLLLALCLPAPAQTVAKRAAESTTKQTVEFGAQGTIQIVDSFSSVKVEGWDKDEVELTLTKRSQSTLQIRHDIGEVHVTIVAGDIEATARIGEIELQLPAEQNYAVDARARIGDVSSEFGPATQRQGMFSVGAKLADAPSVWPRRVFARLGIGDIQVSKLRAEKPEEVK